MTFFFFICRSNALEFINRVRQNLNRKKNTTLVFEVWIQKVTTVFAAWSEIPTNEWWLWFLIFFCPNGFVLTLSSICVNNRHLTNYRSKNFAFHICLKKKLRTAKKPISFNRLINISTFTNAAAPGFFFLFYVHKRSVILVCHIHIFLVNFYA